MLGLRRLRAGVGAERGGRHVHARSAPAARIRARSRPTAAWNAGASTSPGRCRAQTRRAARSPRSAPAARIRARSRPTAAWNAGATTAPGRCRGRTRRAARSAPAVSAGGDAYVRDQDRRRPGMLGPRRVRAGVGPERGGRHVHPGQRRRRAYVRDQDRRDAGMLGLRRLRAGVGAERGGRHVHPGQRRRRAYVRDQDRRHAWSAGASTAPGRWRGRTRRAARSPRSAPATRIRARSRPTATWNAGATTASGRCRGPNAEGGTFTQLSAGVGHTCAIKTAGTPRMLGRRRRRAGVGAQRGGRHVHPGQRRRRAYVRDQDRRDAGMLGLRRLRAGVGAQRGGRHVHAGQRRRSRIRARSRPPGPWNAGATTAPGSLVARRRRPARLPRRLPARAPTSTRSRRARERRAARSR